MFKSIMENGVDRKSALNALENFINIKLQNYESKEIMIMGLRLMKMLACYRHI